MDSGFRRNDGMEAVASFCFERAQSTRFEAVLYLRSAATDGRFWISLFVMRKSKRTTA